MGIAVGDVMVNRCRGEIKFGEFDCLSHPVIEHSYYHLYSLMIRKVPVQYQYTNGIKVPISSCKHIDLLYRSTIFRLYCTVYRSLWLSVQHGPSGLYVQ